MNAPVLFEERTASNGAVIGIATLNAPRVLNGLSLEMVDLLAARLAVWEADHHVAVVILRGAGDKAFCAGGDLHGLYANALASTPGEPWSNLGARAFFEREYRLDYQIHHYSKPLLCWGHGIVMGGGMGLMMGASHRVVTEASKLAMPEISIGLFPDVGGSWLLSRLPGRLGIFLGLTGAHLNASDSLHAGIADFHVPNPAFDAVLIDMLEASWEVVDPQRDGHASDTFDAGKVFVPRSMNDGMLNQILRSHAVAPEHDGPLARHAYLINSLCSGNDLPSISDEIAALADHADPWLARGAKTYLAGSPGSARLTFALQQRAKTMSLADVFRMEFIAVLMACVSPDIRSGIKALLIDKTKNPQWNPVTLSGADERWLARYFEAPWPAGEHSPLEDLGQGLRQPMA